MQAMHRTLISDVFFLKSMPEGGNSRIRTIGLNFGELMKKQIVLTALACATLVAAGASYACSTMVVGKAVSQTGTIIIGHNEDNDLRIVTSQYYVPAADHAAGEMIEYEPDAARIPQVGHTFGFYWTQTLHPAGYSYSDGFVNENGVVIASNQSYDATEDNEALHDGGVGYGIRRLMAERAKSARDAVAIAADLVTRYGYRASGRVYTVADKNEAWQINLLHGGRYVAKKLKDNEVTHIANAYTLGHVDLKDPDVLASPDLIEHAIAVGRYKPAKGGDYSDFNFRVAYQTKERRSVDWIQRRAQRGWEVITGKEIRNPEEIPYSFVPNRKFGVDDVKAVLRAHSKYEKRSGAFHMGMNDICNRATFDSSIYVQDENPLLIRGYRTSGRPSETLYVPFYPLAKPSARQAFLTPEEATAQQFHGKPTSFDYKPDFSPYTFLDAQNYTELLGTQKTVSKVIGKVEGAWNAEENAVYKKAKALSQSISPEKAEDFLHAYNVRAYDEAVFAMRRYIRNLPKVDVRINASRVSKSTTGTIDVAVFGSKSVDAAKINVKTAQFGIAYPDGDANYIELTKASAMKVADVNGDGIKDAVFTFDGKSVLKDAVEGIYLDLWFKGKVGEKTVAGTDAVHVVK